MQTVSLPVLTAGEYAGDFLDAVSHRDGADASDPRPHGLLGASGDRRCGLWEVPARQAVDAGSAAADAPCLETPPLASLPFRAALF